jgi:hypothetical protein
MVAAALALFFQKRRKATARVDTDFLKTPINEPITVPKRKPTPLFVKQGMQLSPGKGSFGD